MTNMHNVGWCDPPEVGGCGQHEGWAMLKLYGSVAPKRVGDLNNEHLNKGNI